MADSDPVADIATEVASDLLKELFGPMVSMGHPIAAAVVNATKYHMTLIPDIHTHHGQYTQAPNSTLGVLPVSAEEEKSVHKNIVTVGMKSVISGTGGVAEAIFGYEFQKEGVTYQLCFYLKHGHHLEAGAALWRKGEKVHGEDYSKKIHKAAESLIHTIQKNRPQTSYSKDGEGASVTVDKIKVSHSSGEMFQFLIEEV
ncbi:hypothetical protein [Photobacterium swingsii]|uniref:hypothetical protein n=1 Tax=Photobacterium swingsii TaxID=680026 RepID=UPI0040687DCC